MEIDHQRLPDDAYRQEVLEALLREYQHRIFNYCVTRLGEALGEEVAQEVFVTAWETLPKFRGEAQLSTWLFGIAKHKCAQAFRNRARRAELMSRFGEDIRRQAHADPPGPSEPLAVEVERQQTHQLARLADNLTKLQEGERIVLILRYYKNLSVTEIVEIVGKSEAAVRKRLLRALHRLKEMMADATPG